MGSKPKAPKPPPPVAIIDEADRAPIDAALARKSSMSLLGYRQTFLSPRGPDEWVGTGDKPPHQPEEAPTTTFPPASLPPPRTIGVDPGSGAVVSDSGRPPGSVEADLRKQIGSGPDPAPVPGSRAWLEQYGGNRRIR